MSTATSNADDLLADDLLARGLAASRSGDSDTAIRLFAEACRAAPGVAVAHFLLGSECASLGRMAEAEAAFAGAVLLDPGMPIARYQLGLLQLATGRPALAHLTWEPLRELASDHPLQRFTHGFAALAHDDPGAALACFREGMAVNVDNAPLNADVQKVIDAIERAVTAPRDAGHAEPVAGDLRQDDGHVLLSGYRQHGPLH